VERDCNLYKGITMASRQTWENWHSQNPNKGSDEELQSMIKDVVEAIHTLERMYGSVASKFVVRSLLQDWHSLSETAKARGLAYESP
jgi:hypothetical protein